ncbi:MAG: TDP-N-acetylfucosamine:lipid II N-acetylfucosaminyltransferase family protein [Chitinophagaceae bacterium]
MHLHITHDNIFLDQFIDNADRFCKISNKYVVYTWNKETRLTHVKNPKVLFADFNSEQFWNHIGDPGQYEVVYFHYLLPKFIQVIKRFPNRVKFVWIFWGGDGFGHPDLFKNYLLLQTQQFYLKNYFGVWNNCSSILSLYKFIFRKRIARNWKKVMASMDYFAHYLENDYLVLKKEFSLEAEFIDFTYAYADHYGPDQNLFTSSVPRRNILLGNSGAETNNHLDALQLLSTLEMNADHLIICPLSYSSPGSKYTREVVRLGQQIFGDRFIALVDFIPLVEYNKLVGECGTYFMPHTRTQAFGNVLYALSNGIKLYFYPENNLFKYLKDLGFIIFCWNPSSLPLTSDPFYPLNALEAANNLALVQNHFGPIPTGLRFNHLLNPTHPNE